MCSKVSLLVAFFTLLVVRSFAQSADSSSVIKLSGYVDAYYAYYTDSVGTGSFQKFPSVSPRAEQFGLNTAMVTAQYDAEKIHGIVSLQFGDIPKSAWSPTFNNIMEAHAGIRLFKWLWLDAGFFRTHFGTEGLLPKEDFESSVAVATYYEPYFESGARLQILAGKGFTWNIYALNGYNVYEDNNHKKSLGNLITLSLEDNWTLSYSNYIGDDSPDGDSISHLRIHQNMALNYQFHHLKVQAGVDFCMQKHSALDDPNKMGTMASGVCSFKYQFGKNFSIYGRGESFSDPNGYMSTLILDNNNHYTGYKLWGATFGLEYSPVPNAYIRIEGRKLQMDEHQEIFYWKGQNKSYRYEMMVNTGISF